MRKIFSVILAVLLVFAFVPNSFALQIKLNDADAGHVRKINFEGPVSLERIANEEITIDVVDESLIAAGAGEDGAASMASITTTIPVSYSMVNALLGTNPAFYAKTLPDGKPGQIIVINTYGGSNALTITPTTSTGWSLLTFNAVGDSVTLLFFDSTSGWLYPLSSTSVTITP